ncbi:MAG: hypothetical protein U0491_00955 [Candidatus Saccharimonadales bacterium]
MFSSKNSYADTKANKRVAAGAMILAGALALAGCGNSDNNAPSSPNTQPVATATPSTPESPTETPSVSPTTSPENVVLQFDTDKLPVTPKNYSEARETLEFLIDKQVDKNLRSKLWDAIESNNAEYFNKLSISKEDVEANLQYYEEYLKTLDIIADQFSETPEARIPIKSNRLMGESMVIVLRELLSRNDIVSKLQDKASDINVTTFSKRTRVDNSPITSVAFTIAKVGKDPEAWSAGYHNEDGSLKVITDDMIIVQEQLKFNPASDSMQSEVLSRIVYTTVNKLGSLCIAKLSGFDTHCDAQVATHFAE